AVFSIMIVVSAFRNRYPLIGVVVIKVVSHRYCRIFDNRINKRVSSVAWILPYLFQVWSGGIHFSPTRTLDSRVHRTNCIPAVVRIVCILTNLIAKMVSLLSSGIFTERFGRSAVDNKLNRPELITLSAYSFAFSFSSLYRYTRASKACAASAEAYTLALV